MNEKTPFTPLPLRELSVAEAKTLYRQRIERDFPKDECVPWPIMKRQLERDEYLCLVTEDGGAPIGYACLMRDGQSSALFLEYFAVEPELRGKGTGTAILKALGEHFAGADCVILEAEDPDTAADAEERALRERRIRFYEKAGVQETAARSVIFGVQYVLMVLPMKKRPDDAETAETYFRFYARRLPETLLKRQTRVWVAT